jgi:hypothetical protein
VVPSSDEEEVMGDYAGREIEWPTGILDSNCGDAGEDGANHACDVYANREESYSAFAITSERSEANIGFASNRRLYL